MTLECSIEFKSWSTSPKKKELIWIDPFFWNLKSVLIDMPSSTRLHCLICPKVSTNLKHTFSLKTPRYHVISLFLCYHVYWPCYCPIYIASLRRKWYSVIFKLHSKSWPHMHRKVQVGITPHQRSFSLQKIELFSGNHN